MIQMKLAILFNDNFRMKHLHNECNIPAPSGKTSAQMGLPGRVKDKYLHVFGGAALLRGPRIQT